jgi:hypothetical protein
LKFFHDITSSAGPQAVEPQQVPVAFQEQAVEQVQGPEQQVVEPVFLLLYPQPAGRLILSPIRPTRYMPSIYPGLLDLQVVPRPSAVPFQASVEPFLPLAVVEPFRLPLAVPLPSAVPLRVRQSH